MANRYFVSATKNLARRNRNRLNLKRSPKQKETEELFYWVLSKLEWKVQRCWPAQSHHSIKVQEPYPSDSKRVLLKFGRIDSYQSQYVTREEFYEVMQEVVNIFNEIGSDNKGNYNFWATYNTYNGSSISVHMTTN